MITDAFPVAAGGDGGPGRPAAFRVPVINGRVAPRVPFPAGAPANRACLVNAAWNALTYVHDPELCLDVVSLGLIYDVREEDGGIVIEMTVATPGCPVSESLPDLALTAVAVALGAAAAVDLHVVRDPPWSPAMIDKIAAARPPDQLIPSRRRPR